MESCTVSDGACMCAQAYGKMTFTCCSASTGAGFIRTIPPCISTDIQTVRPPDAGAVEHPHQATDLAPSLHQPIDRTASHDAFCQV